MSTSYVHLKVENKVGYIEFYNSPHNALPSEMLARLTELIGTAGADPSVAVIVLKSGGDRTFCAGASFDELIAISNPHQGAEFFEGFANVINALRNCPKITIGRVQGKAVGGGVGLAAATDYCMATTHSEIKLSELTIGIGPFVIEPAVTRKIGLSAMSQLSLEASTFFSAQWAQEKGLFMKVCPSRRVLRHRSKDCWQNNCAHTIQRPFKIKKNLLGRHRALGVNYYKNAPL